MSCDFTRTVLHGYLDGELDATRAAEFEHHLEGCRECTTALGAEESLRSSLQRSGLYENAPVSLRKKIRAGLDAATGSSTAIRIPAWRWFAVSFQRPAHRQALVQRQARLCSSGEGLCG